MTGRFAAPELLQLGRPPALAATDFETLKGASIADMVARFSAAGVPFDVSHLETDPAVIVTEAGVYRDLLRRQEIDDAVAQTYLGSATGDMLDQRAADYGVLRRTIAYTGTETGTAEPTRPSTVPTLWSWDSASRSWVEDDESLRTVARLSWEALSVAGPRGAYAFHAANAHPMVRADATGVYGPETGYVEPGEVLVVIQSNTASGVPNDAIINAVAIYLDAHEIAYSNGATSFRQVRDEDSRRPLGARVIVKAAQAVPYYVEAKLFVRPGPDPEVIRQTAQDRLNAYLETRRRIGVEVPVSAIIAALHVADANGLPVVEEVALTMPSKDIVPTHEQLAVVSLSRIDIEVR